MCARMRVRACACACMCDACVSVIIKPIYSGFRLKLVLPHYHQKEQLLYELSALQIAFCTQHGATGNPMLC